MSKKATQNKLQFYSLDKILKEDAHYNVIFSGRSNGKTFATLEYGLKKYIEEGKEVAVIRRWGEDLKGASAKQMFESLRYADDGNHIERITDGKWSDIYYYGGSWTLCRYDETGTRVKASEPFAHAFTLSGGEHKKSTSYSRVGTVIFDEFLTRNNYLKDEFVLFMNVLSTIVRHRIDAKIFMLGNTVNHYSPYFSEMGLTNIKHMQPGDIAVYRYGTSQLKVAVEFAEQVSGGKPSDTFFAFNNPKLKMISGTDKDIWELDLYPHKPCDFKPKDIKFTFFVEFERELLQGEIVKLGKTQFIYMHRKTTPLKFPDKDLIYSLRATAKPNWRTKLSFAVYPIEDIIRKMIVNGKIFYQDNEVGEIFKNYLNESSKK